MLKRFLVVAFAVLVAVPMSGFAQDEPMPAAPDAPAAGAAKKEERRVEPAAQKLLDAAKKLGYSAVDSGLTKMTCTVSVQHPQIPMPIKFALVFEAPEKTTVTMKDLPEEMEPMRPMLEQGFAQMVENMFGDTSRGQYADVEDYHVEMKKGTTDVVIQTAYAADADPRRIETTFGEDGLPTKMVNETDQGPMTMSPKYEKKGDTYFFKSAALDMAMQSMTLSMEYTQAGKFWLVSKIVISGGMGGGITMSATDFTVEPDEKAVTPAEDK